MSAADTERGHVPKPAPWPPAPPDTSHADAWPNRSADVRTPRTADLECLTCDGHGTIRIAFQRDFEACPACANAAPVQPKEMVLPAHLAEQISQAYNAMPGHLKAIHDAHLAGFVEGESRSYVAGWRWGAACGCFGTIVAAAAIGAMVGIWP